MYTLKQKQLWDCGTEIRWEAGGGSLYPQNLASLMFVALKKKREIKRNQTKGCVRIVLKTPIKTDFRSLFTSFSLSTNAPIRYF
jgi:hypothetical protein